MSQIRILVVDGDLGGRRFLKAALELQNYTISSAEDGHTALELVHSWRPDLLVLNVELPTRVDGLQLIAAVRAWSQVPIIAFSVHNREEDTVAALHGGADDYMSKPFGTGELLARIQVALRHAAHLSSGHTNALTIGDLSIDLTTRQVIRQGELLHLTPTEYAILRVLVLQQGCVVDHAALLRDVWDERASTKANKLRVFINQLRRKIEDDPSQPRYLLTESGVGYRFGGSKRRRS